MTLRARECRARGRQALIEVAFEQASRSGKSLLWFGRVIQPPTSLPRPEEGKGLVDVLVIDHIERLTEEWVPILEVSMNALEHLTIWVSLNVDFRMTAPDAEQST